MEFNFWCASGPELSILATTIAIYISELYDAADLATISSFIVTIGDMLSLLAVQKGRCEDSIKNSLSTSSITTNNSSGNQTN